MGSKETRTMIAKDVIQMASNAAMAFSALIVALLGLLGLNTWRKRAKSESAQRLLGLAKKLVAETQATRTMVTYGGESADRPHHDDESEETKRFLNERYARLSRLRAPTQTLEELYETSWTAEALLKVDLSKHIAEFGRELTSIVNAIEALYQTDSAGRPARSLSTEDERDAMLRVYGASAENDPVDHVLTKAVDHLQKKLKKYI